MLPHLLIGLLAWLPGDTAALTGLDPQRYEAHRLPVLVSPTALAFHAGHLYVGCDVLEARPGLYRLGSGDDLRPALIAYLPRLNVEGLAVGDGRFMLTSSRSFEGDPREWRGSVTALDGDTLNTVDVLRTTLNPRCSDGSSDCGLIGTHALGEDLWLWVVKQNTAEVRVMRRDPNGWTENFVLPVYIGGRQAVLTGFKVRDGILYFLARDRWEIAAAPLKDIFTPNAWRLNAEPVFDLTPLKKQFPLDNGRLSLGGFAEGFTFDDAGGLYVVLNNRGYAYSGLPEARHRRPMLVHYTPAPKAEPTPEAP